MKLFRHFFFVIEGVAHMECEDHMLTCTVYAVFMLTCAAYAVIMLTCTAYEVIMLTCTA